jgi:hypothetical protein
MAEDHDQAESKQCSMHDQMIDKKSRQLYRSFFERLFPIK